MNGKAIRSWQTNLLHTKNLRGNMALRTLLGSHPECVIWETEKKNTLIQINILNFHISVFHSSSSRYKISVVCPAVWHVQK